MFVNEVLRMDFHIPPGSDNVGFLSSRLPSLSVSISRSIHVAGEGISSFFVVAKVTFHYVYVLILC